MYRSSFGALSFAFAFSSSAFGQTTPQFSLVDLGPTTVAGPGLPWQAIQPHLSPIFLPRRPTQGASCYGTTTNSHEIVGNTNTLSSVNGSDDRRLWVACTHTVHMDSSVSQPDVATFIDLTSFGALR